MEFPDLGKQCNEPSCKQLDFLPVRCNACSKIFCSSHYAYAKHNCPEAYKMDNQVPICPLCNAAVPVKQGESADLIVGRHIDSDCQSDTANSRRKVFNNKCSMKGCKQKEMMPLLCERCRQNYCLRHRNELDHLCNGFQNSNRSMSNAGAAALSRATQATPTQSNQPINSKLSTNNSVHSKPRPATGLSAQSSSRPTALQVHALQQPGISEDEAIRRAIELSLVQQQHGQTLTERDRAIQEQTDAALARALQESEQEAATQRRLNSGTQSTRQQSVNSADQRKCAVS